MKNIYDLYKESITDTDANVEANIRRSILTKEYLTDVFKRCIPSIDYGYVTVQENGTLKVDGFSYVAERDGINLIADLPDDVIFDSFSGRSYYPPVTAFGDKVTTLAGLPKDLSEFELRLIEVPNLKDCGDVRTCKILYIKQGKENKLDLHKIKRLPKALKYIRLVGFDDVDEKFISKISGTPKNKVSII